MSNKDTWSFYLLVPFFLSIIMPLQVQANKQQTDSLTVGVAGSEPFVVDLSMQTGIALEIWQNAALMEGLSYNLLSYKSAPTALAALEAGKLDIVVGPISITPERATKVKFTQPYYQSSLSIMSRSVAPGIWQRIKRLFSVQLLYAVMVFLFILAIVGTLLWFAEHKVNPDEFSSDPASGIGDGMWCAIVTMTTTGYGDLAPRTLQGRIIAGGWMVICIISATTMVAGIASSLSLSAADSNTIEKASQLARHKVAVVKGSPSDAFVERYNAERVYVGNLKEGYDHLKSEEVDAVVFDRPQMLYFLKQNHDDNVRISQYQYMRQGYGFAIPKDSKKLRDLDITILELQQSGKIERIVTEWLGENN
ncbi:MAG TPA: transporter substrate-binding domain-containing protein [Fodinibius sp.]|nr:transporter substrate-binding domain-containing protein [Fodinibius sp.]